MNQEFKKLYTKYAGIVYSRCLIFCKNDEIACDLVHDIFLLVFKNYKSFKGNSDTYTWIYRITTNTCINYVKKEMKQNNGKLQLEFDVSDNFLQEQKIDHSLLIKQIFASFNKKLQQIALYYFIDDFTQEEIAEILQISRKTVSRKIQFLKDKIKRLIESGKLI